MFARAIVPLVVIGPPVRPRPVVIDVTVPAAADEIVIAPVLPERETPAPAIRLVTPAFVTVTLPVGPETDIPAPAIIVFTPPPPPVEEIVPSWLTLRPAPTTSE